MVNPQIEDGHIDVANELAEAFFNLQLSGNQWRILWVIFRQTYGWKKKTDRISITFFQKKTRLDRRNIVRALNAMVERKIVVKNDNTFISTYGFQKDYSLWKPLSKKHRGENDNAVLSKMTTRLLSKMTPTKEKKETIKRKENALRASFDVFYKIYPEHKAPTDAEKAWMKLAPDDSLFQIILAAIEKQRRHKETLSAKGKFCPEWPFPATWINKRRWEDEIPEVKPSW